ncbi:MAG: TIGR01212 family radical SAM protein, partial [Bacteroidales bacterium]|nr:TIGR01212 family radical SAM protein [Bacteroidales bacterium]
MEKRYNSYTIKCREKFGGRLQKIVIDGGFTCPNRDGTLSTGGCTYCDNAAFHPSYSHSGKPIFQQIEEGIEFHKGRYRNTIGYLAYFQAYSNTYGPLDKLKRLYEEALSHPAVSGIVIGTRPDTVDDAKLDYLAELSKSHIVMVEYGIESCYDSTLAHINRGHTWQQAVETVQKTAARGITQGAHFILGLPGESRAQMLGYAEKINSLPLDSIKFHQLQIIKGTVMEKEFAAHPERFVTFTLDEYLDFFVDLLERLSPKIAIDRFAGEVPPRFVNSTPWGLIRNVELLRML